MNAVKAYNPLTNALHTPDPAKDIPAMVRQLYDMSNALEDMERKLKTVSEVCDWDSYLYNAHEDMNKLHSRVLSVWDQLRMEAM